MNFDGDQEKGDDTEVEQSVDENGRAARVKVAEFDASVLPRHLKQQPRRQQHEQHHRHEHRPPVQHLSLSGYLGMFEWLFEVG